MIGRAVAGESEDEEIAAADFAELLHSSRTPFHNRRAFQAELANEIVGRLRSAGKCSGEDFGMRKNKPLPRTRVLKKRLQRRRVQLPSFGDRLAIGNVAGVQAIDQQNSVDARRSIAKNRTNRTVAGAESAQIDAIDFLARTDLIDERIEYSRIAERLVIDSAALPDIDRRDDERPFCGERRLKWEPCGAVEVNQQIALSRRRSPRRDQDLGLPDRELI